MARIIIEDILLTALRNRDRETRERNAEAAEAEAKAARKLEGDARKAFHVLFGIEVDTVPGATVAADSARSCIIKCGEMTLSYGRVPNRPFAIDVWRLIKECPRCGDHMYSRTCSSLADIAEIHLLDFEPGYLHECEDECEDSLPLPPSKKPTRHEQILCALYEIANAVRCLADRT